MGEESAFSFFSSLLYHCHPEPAPFAGDMRDLLFAYFFSAPAPCPSVYSPSTTVVVVPSSAKVALNVPLPLSPLSFPVPPVYDHVPCASPDLPSFSGVVYR